ncbi:hypothetical protein [Pseudoruegeria sp. HB172150]|uniref:hypothetical protein n=1 Tax=Pseudoruegeria sp. HB172150 TaxID=2721164 RepID=UPI00155791A3|nr:hypothetical protein [Pseudoruegeria sp. HB172150]
MNTNRLVNMAIRYLTRKGMFMGVDAATKRMNRNGAPADPKQKRQNADAAKRARQGMRALRRLTRF